MTTAESSRRSLVPTWLLYTLTAATCWGVWGVLAKGPSRELSGWMMQVLFTFALVPSAIVAGCSPRVKVGSDKPRGLFWGFVSGLLAAAGNIAFYLALEHGADTAVAVPLTNVYPLVTIAIAWLWFRERLNSVQGIGVMIAVVAILLLSGEAGSLAQPAEFLRHLGLNVWMGYTLAAMFFWGVFSATQKISTNHISAELSYLAWCAAFVPIAIWIVVTKELNWHMSAAMFWSGIAAGVLNGFGVVAAFAAYRSEGKAAVVTPLAAAVQPAVTIMLALAFLDERIGIPEAIGAMLAVVGAVALSYEKRPPAGC